MRAKAREQIEAASVGGLLLAATIAVQWIWFGDPAIEINEQFYSLVGAGMLEGKWPYVDHFAHQPFGLFSIFAIAHAALGPGPEAYHVIAGIAAFAAASLTYAIARRLSNIPTALAVTFLSIILVAIYGAASGQSEVFLLPPMLGMVWLLRDERSGQLAHRAQVAMLLGGVALQIDYAVLPQCVVLGCYALYWLWRQDRKPGALAGHAVSFVALGVVPTALIWCGYVLAGYGDLWWFTNVESLFLREASSEGRFSFHVLALASACLGLMAGGYYAAVRIIGPDHTQTYRLVLIWSVACLSAVFFHPTIQQYHFAVLVPAAVLAAIPLLDTRGPGKWAPAVAAPLIALAFSNPYSIYQQSQESRLAAVRMAGAIEPLIDGEADCIFVFDGPISLYRLSGSCTPTRFVLPNHLNSQPEATALGTDVASEVERILAERPTLIVTANRPIATPNQATATLVNDSIETRYTPLHRETIHGREITAWQRK